MRLIFALALVAVSEAAIRAIDYAMDPAPIKAPLKPLNELPTTIGPGSATTCRSTATCFATAARPTWSIASTTTPVDDQVAVNVGVWLDYAPVMPHKPEICYPSAGWEISNRKIVKVSPPGGQPFKARILLLQNKEQRVALLYWALADSTVTLDDNEVRDGAAKTSRLWQNAAAGNESDVASRRPRAGRRRDAVARPGRADRPPTRCLFAAVATSPRLPRRNFMSKSSSASQRPRLLFVNRSYWPDAEATGQLLTELCEDLSARFDVHVIAGQPNSIVQDATFKKHGWDRRGNVAIHRLWHTRFPKANLLGRAVNYLTFVISATIAALTAPRPDLIVVQSDPPCCAS